MENLDIIIVELDVFLSLQPSQPSQLSGAKIDAILALDCFNENIVRAPKFTGGNARVDHHASHGNHGNHGNHTSQASHASHGKPNYRGANSHNTVHGVNASAGYQRLPAPRQNKKQLSYQDKIIREITSNLNKVNTSNMDACASRIRKIVDVNNARMIADIVLTKCCSNGAYMVQLTQLLADIMVNHSDIAAVATVEFIEQFIDNLDATVEEMSMMDYENYDVFCKFTLVKTQTLSANKLVLTFLKNDITGNLPCSDLLFDKMIDIIKIDSMSGHIQDLLVQMIACYIDMFDCQVSFQKFMEMYGNVETTLTTKSKFIFQDIIQKKQNDSGGRQQPRFRCKSMRDAKKTGR
jgi:hypothetical protein